MPTALTTPLTEPKLYFSIFFLSRLLAIFVIFVTASFLAKNSNFCLTVLHDYKKKYE